MVTSRCRTQPRTHISSLIAWPLLGQAPRPIVIFGNLAGLVVGRLRALVGHLEEQQIRQLFDIVAVAHPVVAQDVAVVPEFLDNVRRCHFLQPAGRDLPSPIHYYDF